MTGKPWGVKWRLPTKFEVGLFVLGFIIWLVLDYAQNHIQDKMNIGVMSLFNIPAITLFWVTVLLYHVVLFTAIIRSLVVKGTHPYWDFVMGSLAVFGTYAIIGGAIAGFYYGAEEAIPWLFNISQISFYHIFGVFSQVVAFVWFVVTD